jgi:hypothetical protein
MISMDIVPLRGGFGNQLFCWAKGLQLAHEGRRVLYDRGEHLGRGYELANLQEGRQLLIPRRMWRLLVRSGRSYRTPLVELCLESQRETPQLHTKRAPVTLHWGYWQSSDYFPDVKQLAVGRLASWLSVTSAKEPKVCRVHVRRGDYVTDVGAAQTLGALPVEYYERAIGQMRRRGFEKFVIHTDDPQWAREHLVGNGVGLSTSMSARSDFRSLASASAIIMSNSSFSWWASLVASEREGAMVIGPKNWFRDQSLSSERLMEESWTRI